MQKTISTLVGMLAAATALHSQAAGLQVSPTSLSLPAKQRAGIFKKEKEKERNNEMKKREKKR